MLLCIVFFLFELTLSVCVFENDHVTPYIGVDVDAGESVDT